MHIENARVTATTKSGMGGEPMKRNLSLTQRLMGTLALGTLALLLVGSIGMLKLQQSQERFDYNNDVTYPAIHQMSDLVTNVSLMRIQVMSLASVNAAQTNDVNKRIAELDKTIDSTLAGYQSNYDERDVRMLGQAKVDVYKVLDVQLLQEDMAALKAWRALRPTFADAALKNDRQAEAAASVAFSQAGDRLSRALKAHMQMNFDLAQDVSDANQTSYQLSRNLLLGLIIIASLLSALFGIGMVRNMRASLMTLKNTMQHVKDRLDLSVRVPVHRQDEIGETAEDFNDLLSRLQDNLRTILRGADSVAQLVNQVSEASHQVSNSAQVQNQASASMAAAIEQMTVSITHVAERSQETRQGAQLAGEKAQSGASAIAETINDIHNISQVVQEAASSIRLMDEDSNLVASVVQIIREIADQTNLLALNAAIEAARAGEQGRGFAVVADEVRKLAERTAQSTIEIGDTITKMREHARIAAGQMVNVETLVKTGEQRADQADSAMREIWQSTRIAAEQVGDMSVSISEQGRASQAIAVQVEQVAGMADEANLASGRTAQLSRDLDALAQEQIQILQNYTL
jgi:methyl-accepting chemotaxis protein